MIIAGGGLAGLASALHLTSFGVQVLLIEKAAFPHHKVCGEYISNEVLPYLQSLNADPLALQPSRINRLQITSVGGKSIESRLPLGGFGLSRFALDQYLMQLAVERGCKIVQETVVDVKQDSEMFEVRSDQNIYRGRLVLGAYGKRSQLDRQLNRPFFRRKSPWMAVKSHYRGEFPNDLVALHNFPGGYCGVSKVENNLLNICYLVHYDSFKKYKNIEEHQKSALYQNPLLREIFERSEKLFEAPLSISQVSFEKKEKTAGGMLMIGDSAGLIHPLCGNGMSMAIHSAKIASSLGIDYLNGRIQSRSHLQERYEKEWKINFQRRIVVGRMLSSVLQQERISSLLMSGLTGMPALLRNVIRGTHGKPFSLDENDDRHQA